MKSEIQNGLVYRLATKDDMPRIRELNHELEVIAGTSLDLPEPGDHRTLAMVVFEDSSGMIRGGFYLEKCAELCFFGTDPKVTAVTAFLAKEHFIPSMRSAGMRFCHCQVPLGSPEAIAEALKSLDYENTKDKHSHYVLDLLR